MLKKVTVVLLTLILIITMMSAVTFTSLAANNSRQLKTLGNHLVFEDNPAATIRLTGVNVPGGEWTGTPGVEQITRSVTYAIDNWHCNVIRLPVSTNGWFGNYSYVHDSGKSFRNYIDSVIQIASDKGAYVILDFHHYKSFEKELYIDFWKDAAVRYKNNPTVLFGILNEPHSVSWDVWRNGDGNSIYGHQYVVEMIRDLGAKNIIVAGGLDWAYDHRGIAGDYALVDQGSNNDASKAGYGIMYDSHIYPWKGHTSNWDSRVGESRKKYPVLIGECGWDAGTIKEIANKDPQPGDPLYHDKWCPELLAWMDDDVTYGAKANYTAYCMHPSSAPQLIVNDGNWKSATYSYPLTEYWGVYAIPHLEKSLATRYGTLEGGGIESVSVINPKTQYKVNDSIDLSTGKIRVNYADGTTKDISLSESGVIISGFDSSSACESQMITVSYSGKSASYTVTISSGQTSLSSINISNPKTEYVLGDSFVEPTVTALYTDGSSKVITGAAISGYNMSEVGSQTVTVSYGGITKSYQINIAAPEKAVASIKVSNAKTQYVWGDMFVEPTVTATYTNSYYPDEVVTGVTFTGYNMNEVRTHNVRVVYGGKSAIYQITVSAPTRVIQSISVVDAKTNYVVGDSFVAPSVTVRYTSEYYTDQIITNADFSGYNMSAAGVQTVTVSYGGATTTYLITVKIPVQKPNFEVKAGDVTPSPGAEKVNVPINITKMLDSGNVACLELRIKYDTEKFTWNTDGFIPGSMIKNPGADLIVSLVQPGEIKVSFTSEYADRALTKAMTDADSTFITIVLDVLNTSIDYTAEITLTPGAKLVNFDGETVIGKSDLAEYLKPGSVFYTGVEIPVPESISVSGAKTAYAVGDSFLAPAVTAKYSNGTTKDVTADAVFTGYDMTKAGTQTVTVFYEGMTAEYNITVINVYSEFDFSVKAGEVTAKSGDASVEVPINITNMFTDENIACLEIRVKYDADKFSWKTDSFVPGSMIKNPGADLIVSLVQPGEIKVSFTSEYADRALTKEMTDKDSTFITIILDITDSSSEFISEILLIPGSKLVNLDGETLIKKADFEKFLKSGSVTVEAKKEIGYSAVVSTNANIGYRDEGINVYYVKSLTLEEGNGEYSVTIGDNQLYWSPERKCYVGIISSENYDAQSKKFSDIIIEKSDSVPALKLYGDITGDGRINLSDISALKNYLEYLTPLPVRFAADTNVDGYLNMTDLSMLKNLIEYEISLF